jgi:methyl-accepting chemotaxis protein
MCDLLRLLSRLSLGDRIVPGFGLALGTMGIVGALQYWSIYALVETDHVVAHTTEFQHQLEGAISDVKEAESTGRGYVATGDEKLIPPLYLSIRDVQGHLQALRKLTADDPYSDRRVLPCS